MQKVIVLTSRSKKPMFIRFARWFVWMIFLAVLYFLIELILPFHRSESLTMKIVGACLWSCFFTTVSLGSNGRFRQAKSPLTITIDDDVMRVDGRGATRTLRRGEIRMCQERKGGWLLDGGLSLSEKTPFKARMWSGFIFIPTEMPEYDTIRNLAEMWKAKEV